MVVLTVEYVDFQIINGVLKIVTIFLLNWTHVALCKQRKNAPSYSSFFGLKIIFLSGFSGLKVGSIWFFWVKIILDIWLLFY